MNQNLSPISTYVPVLTTEAGSCLTLANWQEAGIRAVSYQLETLVLKPGIPLLRALPNLKSYTGWQDTIILNAALPPANKQGIYSIRSPFDGSVLRIGQEEVGSLIKQLKPDMAIVPEDFDPALLPSLAETTKTFIAPNEKSLASEANFGWYLSYDKSIPFAALQQKLEACRSKPVYLSGDFDLNQFALLARDSSLFIESNLPALNAMSGKVYSGGEVIDLLSEEMTHQQTVIDEHCQCPTCQQKFTRAYLHHLLMQTPLLCQRFLIQHNVYYYQNSKFEPQCSKV